MSVPYKKKPNRVKDKVRKGVKMPSGGSSGTFAGGHGGTATTLAVDDTVAYKKKPKRKGRPEGS
jgi:hypothetical protein